MRNTRLATLAAFTLLGLPTAANAGERDVHDGFFARAQLGPGYTRMTSEPLRISGWGTAFQAAAGATVAENFSVFGELSEVQIFAPSFTPNGAFADADFGVSAHISGFGAGATYYFMPANVYVSATLRLVRASIEEQVDSEDEDDAGFGDGTETPFRTDLGYGAGLALGKEWWVGAEWGVGAAASFQLSRISDSDDTLWHNGSFDLQVSATWN